MEEEIKLYKYLKSNKFILYVAMFTVLSLAPTSYFVLYSFSAFISPYRELSSASGALIIASAIMIFTVRKNVKMAMFFSCFEMIFGYFYYIYMVVGWDWPLIPALAYATVMPLSVYYYTSEIEVNINDRQSAKKK